jgi:hypothetical protein
LDEELPKDVMGLPDVTVDRGEDEAVVAGAEVAEDVVVVVPDSIVVSWAWCAAAKVALGRVP